MLISVNKSTWQRCWGADPSSRPWFQEHRHGFAGVVVSLRQSWLAEDRDLYLYETSEALSEEVKDR